MQTINVPQLAWFGPRDLPLTMPDDWRVTVLNMEGYARPELSSEAILKAIQNPLGCPPLREIARGKHEVVIVFDDLTRATRTAKIVPHVLAELRAAGISENNIRFICGSGMHASLNRTEFAKKLGEDVVSNFRVFNHNPLGPCTYLGTTRTFQTKVHLNSEYAKCDLRIVIGGCVPHAAAGFGGGGKLLLPGIASFDTIQSHHGSGKATLAPVGPADRPTRGMGITENNTFRRDIDEVAELAGVSFLINVTLNLWGESAAIFAGDWRAAYSAAVEDARWNYRTPTSTGHAIVISNSYTKSNEAMINLAAAVPMVNRRGGEIVIVANAPEGQVIHYLMGVFGKTTFANQYSQTPIPDYVNKVTVVNEYPHPGSSWFLEQEKIVYVKSWDAALADLRTRHGQDTSVAVIPDAANQYFV